MNILSDSELSKREKKIARLRNEMFMSGITLERQEQISKEIEQLKKECEDTWYARHQKVVGEQLERMGY